MAGRLLMFMLISSAIVAHTSGTWCICKGGINDAALQKTLDYACGAGADCNPTRQNGPCFNPNTVRAHCNYAVNSYFQRNRQTPMACDFSGTASIVTSDPSTAGCVYPTSTSATTTTSPVTTTPTPMTPNTGTPITTAPNGGTPFVTTPSNGIIGGNNNGIGPSGTTTDFSDGGVLLPKRHFLLAFSGLILWWL